MCGYRRFFSVTSLAALCQEDPAVFAASHREVARWFSEGLVDGVRIDHPDGLADPVGYLQRLRQLAARMHTSSSRRSWRPTRRSTPACR
jgi:(1->4)-alpha-D-glucan 1-alpha-D-glucosylmutase